MFIPAAPPLPRRQGANKHGYLMHLTAAKLLSYGYVAQEETLPPVQPHGLHLRLQPLQRVRAPRKTAREWYDYYDQEALDLTYEMYRRDFAVFGYSPVIAQRPDLQCPVDARPLTPEPRADDPRGRGDAFRGSDALIGLDLVGVHGRVLRKLEF